MSTDVEAFVEVVYDEAGPEGKPVEVVIGKAVLKLTFSSRLAAAMVGLYSDELGIAPVVEPRGVPDIRGDEVDDAWRVVSKFAHHATWLTLQELSEAYRRSVEREPFNHHLHWGQTDMLAVIQMMSVLETVGGGKTRLVLWYFD